MMLTRPMSARLAVVAGTLSVALAGCGSSGGAATSTSSTAVTTTTSSASSATSSSAAPTTDAASSSAVATSAASKDAFVRQATELVPGADESAVRELRSMICGQLDSTPSRSGVETIVSSLVEQSGLDRSQAHQLIALSTSSGCPGHASLVG